MDQFRQEDVDELFTDLKVIGSVKQHERINTSGPQIRIDAQGILQSVRRTWLGEGRESNMRGIKRAMTSANAFIDLAMAPPRTQQKIAFLERMRRELDNTMRGLRNLQTTYDGDVTTQSRLDVHIENVRNKYEAIDRYIPTKAEGAEQADEQADEEEEEEEEEEEDAGAGAGGGGRGGGNAAAAASSPVDIPTKNMKKEDGNEMDDPSFHTPVQESEFEHGSFGKKKKSRGGKKHGGAHSPFG